jgi:uncharacterized membrane protein (DUF106 family)
MQPNVAPLTAQQRVIELKKKIVEYKSLLSIVTDLSTKSFALLLLGNIEKELVEIQAELGKNQVQPAPIQTPITPVVQPYYPQVPTIGSPVQPYRTGDFPSFPQDPVTFTGGDVFLTNSNEDNQ